MRVRKKPVVVDAWNMGWLTHCRSHLPEPIAKAVKDGTFRFLPDGSAQIATLEGEHTAEKDDWVIQGVAGELYPCKPGIFEATYDVIGG